MKKSASILVFLLGFSPSVWSADSTISAAADAFYNKGECEPAIREYRALIQKNASTPKENEQYGFRIAYCSYNLEKYADAESGFLSYLQKNPSDSEARLKYSQSLFHQGKYEEARKSASEIKEGNFLGDAKIVIARTYLEKEDPASALKVLKEVPKTSGSAVEANYWMGVAHYNNDQDDQSFKHFKSAFEKSDENFWVKAESKSWMDRLETEKRKFHFQLSLGWVEDSNIAQSGSTLTLGLGGPNQGPPKLTGSSTNYTADRGPYASLDLIYNTYASRKHYLTTTLSASSPFYQSNKDYNSESFSLDFSYSYIASKDTSYGLSTKYYESLYNYIYSQDYLILTPYVSSSLTPELWMKGSFTGTMYLNGKNTYTAVPAVDASYQTMPWMYLNFGASYTKSFAPTTKIVDLPPATVTTGTIFSHYSATSFYLGASFDLPADYSISVSDSITSTAYEKEDISGWPNGQAIANRSDKLTTYNATLNKAFIKGLWTGSLSWTYYDNKSDGLKGISSGSTISDNTYTRTYVLASTTLYY